MHPYECLKIGKWIFLIPVIGMLTQSKFHKEFTTSGFVWLRNWTMNLDVAVAVAVMIII
jgi:hypothetical protein